jgi:C1A family cysteine protease
MGIKLTYASKMQYVMLQDIEENEFETVDLLTDYLEERFDREDNKVVYVYFSDASDERPNGSITRTPDDIIQYCTHDVTHSINVYECTSYIDALRYLKTYFETSSLYED